DADGVGDGAVVDERALLAASTVDVEVEGVVAGVEDAAREPAVERLPRVVEDAIPALLLVDGLRRPRPEALRVLHRTGVDLVVDALRHRRPSSDATRNGSPGKVSRRAPEGHGAGPGRLLTNPIDNVYFVARWPGPRQRPSVSSGSSAS